MTPPDYIKSFNDITEYLGSVVSKTEMPKKQITDEDFKNNDLKSIQRRAQTYTEFLEIYVKDFNHKTKSQRIMKRIFFGIVLFLLSVIIIFSFVSLIIISNKKDIQVQDVVTIVTAITGSISSFLILPKVIAEDLFPSKEEDKSADVFSTMFEHDISLRGLYHIPENIVSNSQNMTDSSEKQN